jgi:hypothetical protein
LVLPAPKPAIGTLTETGQPVSFRTVAAANEVSVDFLYRKAQLQSQVPLPSVARHPAAM